MPVLVKDIKYGQDNDLDAAPRLTEEEGEAVKQRMAVLDKLLAAQKSAKYKIEVMLGSEYRSNQPYPGAISFWESGNKLHGGGDTKAYECPGKELRLSDCLGIIPDASQGYGHLMCPDCKTVWKGEQVIGERLYRLSTQTWAEVIYKGFVRLGHNADVYVKRPKVDIRVASDAEQAKQHMGEKLAVARKRELFIYPLKNIIEDVSAGADPVIRFKALLSA